MAATLEQSSGKNAAILFCTMEHEIPPEGGHGAAMSAGMLVNWKPPPEVF